MTERRYRTIVADPPWDHSDGTGAKIDVGFGLSRRPLQGGPVSTAPPYEPMTLTAISSLPVRYLADENAHLYLWTTNRYLRNVWDIAEHWEFLPVCVLTWCKASPGFLGGGTYASNTEFCLFARRGKLSAKRRVMSRWFDWPRYKGPPVREGEKRFGGHSRKPEAFLDMIESVSPGPYLELFARRQRLGWDTWGDEALCHVDLESA